MLSAYGDSNKSNLGYYAANYRGSLSTASTRPGVIERDGPPVRTDRFLYSKREEPQEHTNGSVTPSHPNVKGMPKVLNTKLQVNVCTCKCNQYAVKHVNSYTVGP